MSELTKHELIMIGQLMRREYILNNEKLWIGIIDKLQSMIDNYCDEHKWKFLSADFGEQCINCGVMR